MVISILIILVIALAAMVLYAFVLKPAVSGYAVKVQNQGIEYALSTVAQLSSTCQVVPITIGNQTTNLINVNCLQQPTEAAVVG